MRRVAVICVITASAFTGPFVWASLSPYAVLDQSQEDWNVSYDVGGTTKMAQTFTAGLTGTLDHIEIGTPNFGFESLSTPDVDLYIGQPDGGLTLLTSFTLSDSGYDEDFGNYSVLGDPTPHVPIYANTMYSIVLEAQGPLTAWVGAMYDKDPEDSVVPDLYSRGGLWAWGAWDEVEGEEWGLLSLSDGAVYDMQFRTYVVPVPLPAGVWLGICAVSVAGWHLKRQRG